MSQVIVKSIFGRVLSCERCRDHGDVFDDDAGSQTGVTGLADPDGRLYSLPTPLGLAQIVQRFHRRGSEDEDARCHMLGSTSE